MFKRHLAECFRGYSGSAWGMLDRKILLVCSYLGDSKTKERQGM